MRWPGNSRGLPDSNKDLDGIGDREFAVAPSAGCAVLPAMLNSWAIDAE